MFEKEAEEYANRFWGNKESLDRACTIDNFKDGAEFGYNKGKAETALLSQHILDLQKDKGNLTDRVRELEQQIEKMKCCGNCTKGNCVNIGQKGKACTYWTSNELRR
jgi:hypothetical protein